MEMPAPAISDDDVRLAWRLIARDAQHSNEDDEQLYWWNRITSVAWEGHAPDGVARKDVAVLGDESGGIHETAAAFADAEGWLNPWRGEKLERSECYVCRVSSTTVVLHPMGEREWAHDYNYGVAPSAYIVAFGEDTFAEEPVPTNNGVELRPQAAQERSVARGLTQRALATGAGKAPVLLLASPKKGGSALEDASTRAARRFADEAKVSGQPVECAKNIAMLSDTSRPPSEGDPATELAALLERAAALEAKAQAEAVAQRRCTVQ